MAELLDLPEEVLESSILPFLPWNDLLRCRRVCKAIKSVTDSYIRLHPEKAKAPEIEVTEQPGKDLRTVLALRVPITKLFINNPSGHNFYDNLDTSTLTTFTSTYGPMITSLRVVQLSVYPCFNEWTFLESLTNLKTFEAGGYGYADFNHLIRARTDPRWSQLTGFTYPQNFKNLEVLKIGHNKQYFSVDNPERLASFLYNLQKLDYISFPFCSDIQKAEVGQLRPHLRILEILIFYIREKHADELKTLTFFDFINYHEEKGEIKAIDEKHLELSFNLVAFIFICTNFGVKLLNVNPAWYNNPHHHTQNGVPVVSMVNLHSCVVRFNMPNLEKINVCQTSRSNVHTTSDARPDWPALKTLEINVNSQKAVETETPTQDTALLFDFLWKDIVRGQLTEIILKFKDGEVAIPKTEDVASACPNLRKLKIENWPGTDKQLTKLWGGLTGLQELALECCKELGNGAFFGDDVKNPVFFQLKSMKKLTLKGLDQMPNITDALFSLVLAKMELSHLIIGSDKPLEKITKVGIAALLEGKFAETIEKFPFHGWSLSNMSAEDFEQFAKQFRSYNMM